MLEPAELGGAGVAKVPPIFGRKNSFYQKTFYNNACTSKNFRPFAGTVMLHKIVCSQHSTEWMKLGGFETK